MGPAGKLQTKAVYLCVRVCVGAVEVERKTETKVQIDSLNLHLYTLHIDGNSQIGANEVEQPKRVNCWPRTNLPTITRNKPFS